MRWLIFMLVPLYVMTAQGSEKRGEGESKKEIGGGEFSKHESAMGQYLGKVLSAEKTIKDLIEEKNKTNDELKVHEIATEIQKNLKERKSDIEKYNKEYMIIKYQFPQKGKNIIDKYKRYDEKKAREFEDEVNKLLSDVYSNVKEKYDH